jgi:serralysin
MDGGLDDDRLNGGDGNDRGTGGGGHDDVGGGRGHDTLRGGLGDDNMHGDDGNDRINGEAGRDFVDGGLGRDVLAGGGGSDVFRFASHGALHADLVLDFVHGIDDIALSGAAFGGLGAGPLAAGLFEANADGVATSAAARFVYETDTGRLSYDADGAGAGAASLIATLTNRAALGAGDIEIF